MKRYGTNKVIVVWLLSAIFMIPVISQALHAIHTECGVELCCSHADDKDHSHPKHDCKTCPVCKFTFSHFVESNSFDSFKIVSQFHHTETVTYQERIYHSFFTTNYRRGPPYA